MKGEREQGDQTKHDSERQPVRASLFCQSAPGAAACCAGWRAAIKPEQLWGRLRSWLQLKGGFVRPVVLESVVRILSGTLHFCSQSKRSVYFVGQGLTFIVASCRLWHSGKHGVRGCCRM